MAQLILLTDGVGAPVQVVALDRPYGVDGTAVLALASLVLFTDDVEAAVFAKVPLGLLTDGIEATFLARVPLVLLTEPASSIIWMKHEFLFMDRPIIWRFRRHAFRSIRRNG